MIKLFEMMSVLALVACVVACSTNETNPLALKATAETQALAKKLTLVSEPADAANVIAARDSVKDGDPIRVVGRIGGSTYPWVDGQAAFTIVDVSLRACNDNTDEKCPTPWDYCCESNLSEATALVKIVNEKQSVIPVDARELFQVAELDTIVVQGKAKRDDSGNLTVLADGLFVR
jgi:hypothetical protein